jgi:rod shape-determining protein MreC
VLTFFKNQKTWISLISILVAALLLLFVPSFSAGVKRVSFNILLVPVKVFNGIGNHFRFKRELLSENETLKKRVGELSLEMKRSEELRGENQRFRDLLQFKQSIGVNTISAEVIARDPNDWAGSFAIDKGVDDGIEKDMAVCSSKGLLGKVVDPQKSTSLVILITHPGFKTGGMLRDSRINGIVVGEGKGTVKMLYIPVDAEVKAGEMVITSGFSRIFPKGIVIGEVVSVDRSKTGLYKYATIKPSADSFTQEEVLCIK